MRTLYTIGYGNSTPDEFLARLKGAGITTVLDVRRDQSKSWCRKYYQGFAMRTLVESRNIEYWPIPYWGNQYDTLDAYKSWMDSATMREEVALLGAIIEDDYLDETLCLLCAEKPAYKDGVVNCHRVHVADALVEALGSEWSVKHL